MLFPLPTGSLTDDPKMPARFQHGCRKSPVQHRARRGAAAVEFAVCLPVLVLLVFGSIEASSFIFLKQSISVSAYEGVRDAIRNEGSNATARQRIENILNSRGVQGYAVAFPSGESADADRGDEIIVEVSAPTQPNSPLAGQFIANRTIRSRVVMIKE